MNLLKYTKTYRKIDTTIIISFDLTIIRNEHYMVLY